MRMIGAIEAIAAELGQVDPADEGDLVIDHDDLLVMAVDRVLARIQSALIRSVTFTPAALGPANGTLDTSPGGPTATLSGTGVPIEPHVARKCKKGKKHSARSAKRKKCKKKGKR